MTIQLPRDLAVADLVEVQILHTEPGFSTGTLVVNTITVPVDRGSIVDGLVAEQVEAMLANAFGAANDLLRGFGKKFSQSGTETWDLIGREEKARLHLRVGV